MQPATHQPMKLKRRCRGTVRIRVRGYTGDMSTITFDTFNFVDRLEKAGMPREQAAALAQAQKEIFSEALDTTLATKADIARLDNKIDNKFESLTKDIQAMELRLTIKLGAFLAVAVGVMLTVLKMH